MQLTDGLNRRVLHESCVRKNLCKPNHQNPQFHFNYCSPLQVLPVDLTRTIDPKTDVVVGVSAVGPRKLAFSVENILDPTKFTGRKEGDNYSNSDRNNNQSSKYGPAGTSSGELRNDEELSQNGE